MRTKEQIIELIAKAESKQAEYGVVADALKQEMILCYSEYKKGDKVLFKPEHSNKWRNGIVKSVTYDLHDFMTYIVIEHTSKWQPSNRNRSGNYINKESIKKFR
jgi:hypothetical protein